MSNAAIIYDNLADAGSVSASSWIAAAPPSNVQDPHVSRRWEGRGGASDSLILDLGALLTFDSIALLSCAAVVSGTTGLMTTAAITQIRVASADNTGVAGDVYNSGSAAGRISSAYGSLIHHFTTPVVGRYIRIDLTQPSASAVMAGRLVVGLRNQFTINFSYGWSYGYVDLSRMKKSAGGQTFVEIDEKYRVLRLSFDVLDEDDRYSFVQEADRLNGISQDVLFVRNPASTDPARDTIWGLMKDLSPPSQPSVAHFSKVYSIEERL